MTTTIADQGRERVGRLAAEHGLSAEQGVDIHARVMQAARLRAVLPARDLSLVDRLFETVAEDASARHLFERAPTPDQPPVAVPNLGSLPPDEYRRLRQADSRR